MVGTVQAVGLLLLAVLPGAVLVVSYERHAGPLADDINERTLRFIVGTALIFPYAAGLAGSVYTRILHVPIGSSRDTYRNRLLEPSDVSLWWYAVPVAYVLVPWGLGRFAGLARIALRRRTVRRRTASLVPGLEAWDIVFLESGPKLIAMKIRGGSWVAGVFAGNSFASAPAAKERELVLEVGVEVDERGTIQRDDDGTPLLTAASIVVAYADVELMTVQPA